MNNAFKYYKLSGEILDFFVENLKDPNFNFEKVQKKFQKERKFPDVRRSLNDSTCFFNMANTALIGLNKEKVENAVETNWDNYKPESFLKLRTYPYTTSQIPYFREWFGVFTCKDKHKQESSKFWIKKIRDELMHGNYELDLSTDYIPNGIKIKLLEKSKSGAVVFDAQINELGLNEFVEDNFTNVLKGGSGIISEELSMFGRVRDHISTRNELEAYLSKMLIAKRSIKDGVVYDGKNKIDKTTGKLLDESPSKEGTDKFGVKLNFVGPDYFDSENAKYLLISKEIMGNVIAILEKNNVYASSSQTSLINDVIAEYFIVDASIYANIDAFKHLFEQLTWFKMSKADDRKRVKECLKQLYIHRQNIQPALTVLKLYRMLYAMQNSAFPKIDAGEMDFSNFDVALDSEDRFMERAQKKLDESGDRNVDAMNELAFEIIRNSLAHGNVQVFYEVKDNKIISNFEFSDKWINRKTGEEEKVTIYALLDDVNELVKSFDDKLLKKMNDEKREESKVTENKNTTNDEA